MHEAKWYVCYEDFGAAGDGCTDDAQAIFRAHTHANERSLPVKTNPDRTYYIGSHPLQIPVMTDTDWGTSRFIIDDSGLAPGQRHAHVFHICSKLAPIPLPSRAIAVDQVRLDLGGVALPGNAMVVAKDESRRQFMRVGLNQSDGEPQTDCFLLDQSGYLLTPLLWDCSEQAELVAYPVDPRVLTVTGGVFTTIANQAASEYTYYGRGVLINRSRVRIHGLTHLVTGELDHGAPYHGFIRVEDCSDVRLEDCHLTGRKIYDTIGSAGLPVSMGSYDISLYRSIGISFLRCTQDNIMDMSLWGVYTSNYCKDILVDGCTFSRVDAHMDVTGYTIRNSTIGWMGIKAIGHGLLTIENVTVLAGSVLELRSDYGSNWDGDLIMRDVTWYPVWPAKWRNDRTPALITAHNTGDHDFGYPCGLPRRITIENVRVMDGHLDAAAYENISILFTPAETNQGVRDLNRLESDDHACAYAFASAMTLNRLSTQSGKGYSLWAFYPVNGYGRAPHDTGDAFTPNFRASIDGMDRFTLLAPKEAGMDVAYGKNHRIVPDIEIRNCGEVVIDEGALPMRIVRL